MATEAVAASAADEGSVTDAPTTVDGLVAGKAVAVEPGQYLALRDVVSFLEENFLDDAFDLGDELAAKIAGEVDAFLYGVGD
mgnify:CR=1 FL=1